MKGLKFFNSTRYHRHVTKRLFSQLLFENFAANFVSQIVIHTHRRFCLQSEFQQSTIERREMLVFYLHK